MDERDTELGFQLRLENVASTQEFDELLEVALEICLQDTSYYEECLQRILKRQETQCTAPNELVQKFGVWALRTQYDMRDHYFYFYDKPDDGLPHPLAKDLLVEPPIVPLKADAQVQAKIETLGMAIIEEAFNCLGSDAIAKAEAFSMADDAHQQYEILTWLYDRVGDIRDSANVTTESNNSNPSINTTTDENNEQVVSTRQNGSVPFNSLSDQEQQGHIDRINEIISAELSSPNSSADNDFYYHPTRLSPKFIGSYPDIEVRTTCLGVSILVAAFLHKAGADYLHAGVMNTALEATRMVQIRLNDVVDNVAYDRNITLQSAARTTIDQIDEAINGMRRSEMGHHANIVTRLADGSWVHVDPNFHSLYRLSEFDNNHIQAVWDELQADVLLDPGLPRIVRSFHGGFSETILYSTIELVERPYDIEVVSRVLQKCVASGDVHGSLKDYLLGEIASLAYIDEPFDLMTKMTFKRDKEAYVDSLLDQVINKYFYDGMDTAAFVKRYHSDERFRERRVEDLAMLPMMFMLKSASEYGKLQKDVLVAPAALLEVGRPEFRIGACVMSDFALYTDAEIPLSFWAANWSSHVALESHLPDKNDESAQAELGRRLSSILRSNTLRHYISYGMVHKFLEQGENSTHDNQEE